MARGLPGRNGVKELTVESRKIVPPAVVKGVSNTNDNRLYALSTQSIAVTPMPAVLDTTASLALNISPLMETSLVINKGLAESSSAMLNEPVIAKPSSVLVPGSTFQGSACTGLGRHVVLHSVQATTGSTREFLGLCRLNILRQTITPFMLTAHDPWSGFSSQSIILKDDEIPWCICGMLAMANALSACREFGNLNARASQLQAVAIAAQKLQNSPDPEECDQLWLQSDPTTTQATSPGWNDQEIWRGAT